MANQAMKLSILIGADASGMKTGGAEAEAVLGKIKVAANDAGQSVRQLLTTQSGLSRAAAETNLPVDNLKAYGLQLDALRAKYNPVFAVIRQYKATLAEIKQARAAEALSEDEMTAAISRNRQATLASIDAIKGRNAAIRSSAQSGPLAANSNVRGFETANIAAQFQDIGVTAAMGMSPLQIALQQGTQLSSVVAGMKNPIAGLAAAFGSLLSPVSLVTIGVVGLSAAVIQYGAEWLSTSSNSEEALQRQRDLVAEVAQKWGEALPALKAYNDERQKGEDATKQKEAVDAGINLTWAGARDVVASFNLEVSDAISKLQTAGASTDDIVAVQTVWQNLQARIASGKASFDDVRAAQTTLALAMNQNGVPAIDGMAKAWANLLKIVDQASGRSRRLAGDLNTDLKDYTDRVKQGTPYTEAMLKLQQFYHDRYNPSNIPAGVQIPIPEARPQNAYPPIDQGESKTRTAYEQLTDAADRRLAQLRNEITIAGQATDAQARLRAEYEAEADYREQIAREGGDIKPEEIAALRQKAALMAEINAQLAAQKAVQQGAEDNSRLQLEISLVGQSAETRERSIAAFEAEKQIRDLGIKSISAEADAIRANSQARAELNIQLSHQQQLLQMQQTRALFDANQAAADARTPDEKAEAAREIARKTIVQGESGPARDLRIELAGKEALLNAERELKRAQEDRVRSATASVTAAQYELSIAGQSAGVRARLMAEFQAEQQYREAIARSGGKFNQEELDALKQKAGLLATINQQLAGQKAVQDQNDDISRLQLEISLAGASAEVRAKSIAAYETEKQIRDQGIDSMGREAQALRDGAQARAEMQLQLERTQAAYQSLQQAEGSAIDSLVSGTGSLKDRLKGALDGMLKWFQEIAVANPLKNMLTGTNLPTLTDLFTGKAASPVSTTSTAAMTVTAGSVMINGVSVGTPSFNPFLGATATVPGTATASSPFAGASASVSRISPAANQNSVASLAGGTDVQSQVWNYWAAKGLQPYQIAGIMGNINAESAFRPGAIGDNGAALGLAQWNSRAPAMTAAVPDWRTNVQGQLDFMNHEFQTSENSSWQQLLASRNTTEATAAMAGFERPRGYTASNPQGADNWSGRLDGANAALDKFGQTTATASTQVNTMGTGALDASKALTQGDGSLVSSITKASETAAQPAPAAPAAPVAGALPGAPEASGGNMFSSLFGMIGSLTKGIGSMFSNLFSSLAGVLGKALSGVGSGIGGFFSSILGGLFADGAAFSGGNVIAFAGGGAFDSGVFDKPTLFPMAGGKTGLMGEAGPEAIMPLRRGSDGRLGVTMALPKQARQGGGGGEMRFRIEMSNSIVVGGNGDKELHANLEAANRQQIEDNIRRLRDEIPDIIEQYNLNPHERMRSI